MKKKLLAALSVSIFLGLAAPISTFAATTPSLGLSATYGVLSSTYTNTTAGTTINGSIGFTTPPAVYPGGMHTYYGVIAPYSTAGTDQNSTLSALAAQPCTFTFAPGAIDLATDTTHGAIGVYTPGVYCTTATSAASIGAGGITLNGNGTYIFRINGALTTAANSVVTLANGASACNVFRTPTSATTLGANSTFVGTDIDAAGITVGSTVTWLGQALSFGGTVTTDTDTITVPTCTAPVIITGTITTGGITTGALPSPVINIVKTTDRSAPFPFGGGNVVYTYMVSNPGVVAMSDIVVVDDTCSPLALITGDANRNHLLETTETWTYTCEMLVSASTRNVAIAQGMANGFTVRDQDFANVYVSAPALPATGLPMYEETTPSTTPWNIVIFASMLLIASLGIVVVLKRRKI